MKEICAQKNNKDASQIDWLTTVLDLTLNEISFESNKWPDTITEYLLAQIEF
jgi:hypothetical protein